MSNGAKQLSCESSCTHSVLDKHVSCYCWSVQNRCQVTFFEKISISSKNAMVVVAKQLSANISEWVDYHNSCQLSRL